MKGNNWPETRLLVEQWKKCPSVAIEWPGLRLPENSSFQADRAETLGPYKCPRVLLPSCGGFHPPHSNRGAGRASVQESGVSLVLGKWHKVCIRGMSVVPTSPFPSSAQGWVWQGLATVAIEAWPTASPTPNSYFQDRCDGLVSHKMSIWKMRPTYHSTLMKFKRPMGRFSILLWMDCHQVPYYVFN